MVAAVVYAANSGLEVSVGLLKSKTIPSKLCSADVLPTWSTARIETFGYVPFVTPLVSTEPSMCGRSNFHVVAAVDFVTLAFRSATLVTSVHAPFPSLY